MSCSPVSEILLQEMADQLHKFGLDSDCPVFDDLAKFCNLYAGASIGLSLLYIE